MTDRPRRTLHLILPRTDGVGLHHVLSHRFVPLNLMTVGALAEREGWSVRVVDENYEVLPDERPDLVGITVWTLFAPRAYRLADRYRADGVPVVLGGVHASLLPGEALDHADAVVVGEAEAVMPDVLADAAAGRLGGIYRGRWDELAAAPDFAEVEHFYDDFPTWRYWPQYSVQSTRGCRFNCGYCSVIRINGRGARHRDAAAVVESLRRRTAKNRLTAGLFFTDDDFGSDLAYTTELLEAMIRARLRVMWGAQTSIGIARHPELLALAKRAGCRYFFLGLESVSRQALREANKKNRPEEYRELIGRIKQSGIGVEGSFIFGFDTDDASVFADTVEVADEIGCDLAFFNVLTPFPGTRTFAELHDAGRIVDYDWSRYTGLQAVYRPAQLTRGQLDRGIAEAYRDFYSPGRRLQRYRRQVRELPPDLATIIAVVGGSFGREFRRIGRATDTEAPYTPPPRELDRLALVSRADANDAVWLAADLAEGLDVAAAAPRSAVASPVASPVAVTRRTVAAGSTAGDRR